MKRPLELETQLRAPVLLTIPQTRVNGRLPGDRKRLRDKDKNGKDEQAAIAPWDVDHFIRPYSEAIRDRLGLYFKLNGMTHKPKLVGVTGFSQGSGISTLAAGLAAALSEMGDGKVLLVDVNVGSEDVHPFFKGKSAHSLTAALKSTTEMTSAAEGLYLATVSPQNETPMPLALKKFFDLMPNLKTSDFDYIIFDMPALSQISPTLGIAGFMDKTLVIVEAEKSNRDSVRRGYQELIAARANVSIVLNKTRSYVPKWLDTES
jgi:Mrp family chromosome partitioning ATPase